MNKSIVCAFGACLSSFAPAQPAVSRAQSADWTALRTVIDGPEGESWISFHPSGKAVVFGRNTREWKDHRVYVTRLVNGKWTRAQPAPFTKDHNGYSARFSADGRSLLFSTTRPLPAALQVSSKDGPRDQNIWRVPWDGERFGEAVPVMPVNSAWGEIEAIEVAGGTIYFSSTRSKETNAKNNVDIYKAAPDGRGGYVVSLVDGVNSDHVESTMYVTPDERMMLLSRSHDPAGLGKDDIFVSFNRAGRWSPPKLVPGDANSAEYEYGPELSRDGRTLYVTSHRSGMAGIIALPMPDMN